MARRKLWLAILLSAVLPLCAGLSCAALLWSTLPYSPRAVVNLPPDQLIYGLSPDGRTLVSRDMDDTLDLTGRVRLWDVATGKHQAEFLDDTTGVYYAKITGDGKLLVIQEYPSGTLRLFDLASGNEIAALHVSKPDPNSLGIWFLSPDGRTLAYPTFEDGRTCLWLWDIPTRSHRAIVRGVQGAEFNIAASLVFSPDSKLFATGDTPNVGPPVTAGQVVVRNTSTGNEVAKLTGYEGIAWNLHFSSDGSKLMAHWRTDDRLWTKSNDRRAVVVWDVRTRKRILSIYRALGGAFVAGNSAFVAITKDPATRQYVVNRWDFSAPDRPTELDRLHPDTDSYADPISLQDGRMILFAESHRRENELLMKIGEWIGRDDLGTARSWRTVLMDLSNGKTTEMPHAGARSVSSDGQTISNILSGARSVDSGRLELYDIPPRRSWARILGWSALLSAAVFVAGRRWYKRLSG